MGRLLLLSFTSARGRNWGADSMPNSEAQLHLVGAWPEPGGRVDRLSLGGRVEADAREAEGARIGDGGGDERARDAAAAPRRPRVDVQQVALAGRRERRRRQAREEQEHRRADRRAVGGLREPGARAVAREQRGELGGAERRETGGSARRGGGIEPAEELVAQLGEGRGVARRGAPRGEGGPR